MQEAGFGPWLCLGAGSYRCRPPFPWRCGFQSPAKGEAILPWLLSPRSGLPWDLTSVRSKPLPLYSQLKKLHHLPYRGLPPVPRRAVELQVVSQKQGLTGTRMQVVDFIKTARRFIRKSFRRKIGGESKIYLKLAVIRASRSWRRPRAAR
jgi:hypothetical protein